MNGLTTMWHDDQNKQPLEDRKRKPGRYVSTCKIPRDFLNDNSFSLVVKGADEQTTFFEEVGCSFDVSDSKDPQGSSGVWTFGSWPRVVVRPKLEWDVKYNSFED